MEDGGKCLELLCLGDIAEVFVNAFPDKINIVDPYCFSTSLHRASCSVVLRSPILSAALSRQFSTSVRFLVFSSMSVWAVMESLDKEKTELLMEVVLRELWRTESHLLFMLIVWMRSLRSLSCFSVDLEEVVMKTVSISLLSLIIVGMELAELAAVLFLASS